MNGRGGGKRLTMNFVSALDFSEVESMPLAHKGLWFMEFFIDSLVRFLVRTQLDLVPVPAIYLHTVGIKRKGTDCATLSLWFVSKTEHVFHCLLWFPLSPRFSFPDADYWRLSLVWEHLPNTYSLKKPCKAATVQFFLHKANPGLVLVCIFVYRFIHTLQ